MHFKKGYTNLGLIGFFIILAIAVIVFGTIIVKNLNIGIDNIFGDDGDLEIIHEESKKSFNIFKDLVSKYEKCKDHTNDKCICELFEYSGLPEDFNIKITNFEDRNKVRIELLHKESQTDKDPVVLDNNKFCFYNFVGDKFEFISAKEIDISNEKIYEDYKAEGKMQLYKFDDEHVCFVQKTGREAFNALTVREKSCELMEKDEDDVKLAMLDIGASSNVGNFDGETIGNRLLLKLGQELQKISQVSRITEEFASVTTRSERRKSWFDDKYDKYGKDKIYVISLSVRYMERTDLEENDEFIIHYLEGSEKSKYLADRIKSRLEEIKGEYYIDGEKKEEGKVLREYKVNAGTTTKINSPQNVGPVFLACVGDYEDFPFCDENTKIPAVFIEAVEVYGDGAYMFTGHYEIYAQKIYEGVNDYLIAEKQKII